MTPVSQHEEQHPRYLSAARSCWPSRLMLSLIVASQQRSLGSAFHLYALSVFNLVAGSTG